MRAVYEIAAGCCLKGKAFLEKNRFFVGLGEGCGNESPVSNKI